MKLEFTNGSVIESLENPGETHRGYRFLDDTYVTLTIKGNYTDKDHRFYSTEVLYEAWKDYIGKEIECENNEKRIVLDVNMDGDFIFVNAMKVKMK